ncbi:hypothetical protein N8083_01440 [Candidatus Pacebacteria bacterium]|nr:hypothetical protein [Candidatus Paceibacterota bacterium]
MEDYLIAKLVRRIIAPIVSVLIFCSLVYGWWIGDYPKAFRTVYVEPMQYVATLILQPKLNKMERALDQIGTTTESGE